jgi:hypothetical protein
MPATTFKGYTVPAYNTEVGTWGTDINSNFTGIADLNVGGQTSITLSGTNVTLTTGATGQMQNVIISLTGTLLASVTVSSAAVGFYAVENGTTGAFNVTWQANFGSGPVGSGIVIPQGTRTWIISDTTSGARACPTGLVQLLLATSGASPLTIRRTENDTTLRKILSLQSGLGSGNDYSLSETGDGSSNVVTVTEQIGTTVIGTMTASGYTLPQAVTLAEVSTPTAPAASYMQLYAYNGDFLASQTPGGVQRLYGKDPTIWVLTAGSGTVAPRTGVVRWRVRMVGGGGGGGALNGGTNGTAGGTTSLGSTTALGGGFGFSAVTAVGGTGGNGGAGGLGSQIYRAAGADGGSGGLLYVGPPGGSSVFGGGGAGSVQFTTGGSAKANTGSGGGGGAISTSFWAGSGGGAGEYVEFYVMAPSLAGYSYTVGAGGTGGTGSSGGGAGAAGVILIEEFYN